MSLPSLAQTLKTHPLGLTQARPAKAEEARLRAVNPEGTLIPGISQAMRISGGDLLVLSGHVPMDATGAIPEGLEAQLDQVFRNLAATLAAAGTDFGAVARLTLYVRGYDPAQLATIRAIRDRYVDATNPPASALIGVAALFDDRALVEVDALALAPPIH
jgi:enamine deaminase RidA (YjgF/YER057c/UK114 family)